MVIVDLTNPRRRIAVVVEDEGGTAYAFAIEVNPHVEAGGPPLELQELLDQHLQGLHEMLCNRRPWCLAQTLGAWRTLEAGGPAPRPDFLQRPKPTGMPN